MALLDLTYGQLVKGAEAAARARLDAHAHADRNRFGQEMATT